MAYATKSDILEHLSESELIQLTDDDDEGVVDDARVTRAIEDADSEINGYCGKRYALPFDPVPGLVRKFSVDIAIYNLYFRRSGPPEKIATRYKDAIAFLRNVAKGLASLGIDDPDTPPSDTHKPQTSQPVRIFSRETLEGW